MNYEIIQMNKKTFIGFKTRIKDDETIPEKIRNLWKKLYFSFIIILSKYFK